MDKKILVTRSSMPPYEEFIEAIKPLWETHWLTNMGKYHNELESQLKQYLNVKELSLMVNGHMALEMAIQAMNFPVGSEVITTPFTFVSTTHAIVRNNLQPVFCDIHMEDGTIDESKIEELITERTVAIVPVHVYGNVCNIDEIQRLAEKYHLKVIYDAAHAFGVEYEKQGIGSYGDASVFSFHATKVFNTIEGGAVTFRDHKLYESLYNLKNFGIRSEESIVAVGANAKLNEMNAIMGLCNLRHIDCAIEHRKCIYKRYERLLRNIGGIKILNGRSCTKYNYAYLPIVIRNGMRDGLYEFLKQNNIYARKYFYPLTCDAECFNNEYTQMNLENARSLSADILVLPLYEELQESEVDMICKLIEGYLKI